MLHEARQVGEVTPEPIQLGCRTLHADRLLYFDRLTSVDGSGATRHVIAIAMLRGRSQDSSVKLEAASRYAGTLVAALGMTARPPEYGGKSYAESVEEAPS